MPEREKPMVPMVQGNMTPSDLWFARKPGSVASETASSILRPMGSPCILASVLTTAAFGQGSSTMVSTPMPKMTRRTPWSSIAAFTAWYEQRGSCAGIASDHELLPSEASSAAGSIACAAYDEPTTTVSICRSRAW